MTETTSTRYAKHRSDMARRQNEMSAAGRDIGELPEIENPERREKCIYNFQCFCEEYFPETYRLAWSPDHLKAIQKIETAVLKGGLFALAMSRGSGKSTLSETACIWAMLYGHRQFITLIGATETAATEMLASIKTEIELNELLAADFPEVCYPIAKLEGITNRCAGQLYDGKKTKITWTQNEIVLPYMPNSAASGVVARVAGITGRIRGMKYKRADGRSVRPELVIIDDPQTRESANSIEQNRKRIQMLSGDILGLAGPGQKISGIMPCTIIRPGDMAEQILDRKLHPDWNGERCKMVYKFPDNLKMWEKYAEIRAESFRTKGNFEDATQFYAENREEMDRGSIVGWTERYNHDELSAIQHAMNLKLQDEEAFFAEYQNEPLIGNENADSIQTPDEICQRLSGIPRYTVPLKSERVVMFVDVQKTLLFYVVTAWSDDFTGSVIDYGAWPEQKMRNFTLNKANPTIQSVYKTSAGLESQLYAAMGGLFNNMMNRDWTREDGVVFKIDKAMIDANWGTSTDVVYQFCRNCDYVGKIIPSHGKYIGAGKMPISEYTKKQGDRIGFNWYMPGNANKRNIRYVIYDTNFWKTFIHMRLAVGTGGVGSLTLYGRNPVTHELLANHLTAEYCVKTAGHGRIVDEWKIKPEHFDNHWLDGVVGCAVLASITGAQLKESAASNTGKRERIKLSDIARQQNTKQRLRLSSRIS